MKIHARCLSLKSALNRTDTETDLCTSIQQSSYCVHLLRLFLFYCFMYSDFFHENIEY